MTCSILSAIMARTKVLNWARKPGWRIAANDRLAGGAASAGIGLISFIKQPLICCGLQPESRQGAPTEHAFAALSSIVANTDRRPDQVSHAIFRCARHPFQAMLCAASLEDRRVNTM